MRSKRLKSDLNKESIKSNKEAKVKKTLRNTKSKKIQLKAENVEKALKEGGNKIELENQDKIVTENNGVQNETNNKQKESNQRPQCSHCSRYFKSTAGLRRHEISCNSSTSKETVDITKRSRKHKPKITEVHDQKPSEQPEDVNNLKKHSTDEIVVNEKSASLVEDNICEKTPNEIVEETSNQVLHDPIVITIVDKINDNELSDKSFDSVFQPETDPLSINCGTDRQSDNSEVIIKDENRNDENIMIQQPQCMYCCKSFNTLKGTKRHEKHCKNKPPSPNDKPSLAPESQDKEIKASTIDGKSIENNQHTSAPVNGKQLNDYEEDGYSSESSFGNKCECCGEDKETAHIVGDFECHECRKLFRQKSSLERHIRVVHNGESHECPQCGAKCPDKGTLARHMYTHTGLKPYSCPVCKQEFSRKYHLVRHNMQTGCDGKERPVFPCQVCGREFNRKDNLREHLRAHAGQTKRKRKFTCDSCGLVYEATELLKMHKKTHMVVKQYTCDFCPKQFAFSGAMKKHRRTHTGEKPYECVTCHRRFAAKETLNRHVRLHTGHKPHTCQYCGKSFIQSTQLKSHLYYHTGQSVLQPTEVFVCDLCGKKFNRKARLNEHVKFVHLGAKPFSCEQCGKTFIRKEDLNRHLIIHSGVKAHQCPICSKAFTMKSTLKVHLLTHTKEPPRSCDECGRAFIRQDCLLRHMRNKHKEMLEEIKCEAEKKKLQQQLLQVAAEASLVEGMEERKELDENGLVDAVRELLTLLVDETTLKGLGWPDAGVEALLEAVIKRCGHEPAPSSTPRHDRLRHNIKLLFTVVIDDSAVKALLNNQTVDEVILHVLRLAKS